MAYNYEYPYVDPNRYNSDWILSQIKGLTQSVTDFIKLNTIKYADPILWNITAQYEANTVVIDPSNGTAYLSTAAVPQGINITDSDYWTPIFNYSDIIDNLRENVAIANQKSTSTAIASYPTGTLIWYNDNLYVTLSDLSAGDALVIDSNIEKITLEKWVDDLHAEITTETELLITKNAKAMITEYSYYPNIKLFGAVGDGVADDTEAFQAFIDSNSDIAYIPDGTYNISTNLDYKQKGFIIEKGVSFSNYGIPDAVPTLQGRMIRITDSDSGDISVRNLMIIESKDGTKGWTQSNQWTQTIVEKESTTNNYIWGVMSTVRNYSPNRSGAEDVAVYGQIRREEGAVGGVWGFCSEVRDLNGDDVNPTIGCEVGLFLRGSNPNNRLGVHIPIASDDGNSSAAIAGVMVSSITPNTTQIAYGAEGVINSYIGVRTGYTLNLQNLIDLSRMTIASRLLYNPDGISIARDPDLIGYRFLNTSDNVIGLIDYDDDGLFTQATIDGHAFRLYFGASYISGQGWCLRGKIDNSTKMIIPMTQYEW